MENNENEHSLLDLNFRKNIIKAGKFDDEFLNDSVVKIIIQSLQLNCFTKVTNNLWKIIIQSYNTIILR